MDPTETRKLGRNSNARSKFCSGTCTPYQSTELAPTGSASSDSSRLEAKARAGARAGAPGRQAAEEPFKQIGARSTWIDAGFAAGLQKCSRLSRSVSWSHGSRGWCVLQCQRSMLRSGGKERGSMGTTQSSFPLPVLPYSRTQRS